MIKNLLSANKVRKKCEFLREQIEILIALSRAVVQFQEKAIDVTITKVVSEVHRTLSLCI